MCSGSPLHKVKLSALNMMLTLRLLNLKTVSLEAYLSLLRRTVKARPQLERRQVVPPAVTRASTSREPLVKDKGGRKNTRAFVASIVAEELARRGVSDECLDHSA